MVLIFLLTMIVLSMINIDKLMFLGLVLVIVGIALLMLLGWHYRVVINAIKYARRDDDDATMIASNDNYSEIASIA